MSLRLRLLLAVGAIAIVALVVADFATYSALRSSLYNQVDQQLAPAPSVGRSCATRPPGPHCPAPEPAVRRSGTGGNSGRRPGGGEPAMAAPTHSGISYIAVADAERRGRQRARSAPPTSGTIAYRPSSPHQITGFTTQPDGTQVAYFTAGVDAGGRTDLPGAGDQAAQRQTTCIVQAQPLTDPRPAPCTRCSSSSWR